MSAVVLPWKSETAITPYPLESSFGYDGLIVDAHFIQFDNFIPTLNYFKVVDRFLFVSITFDTGPLELEYSYGQLTENYNAEFSIGGRYLGFITFGKTITRLTQILGDNTQLKINKKFLPHLVKSIPSKCGVFSLNDKYGDLIVDSDRNIWFDVDDNEVTFNAVYYPLVETENYLKTLNTISPVDNNVFIKNTNLIKLSAEPASVIISLIGTGLTKENSVIISSDGG